MTMTNEELQSFRTALEAKRAESLRMLGQNTAGGTHSADESSAADPMDAAKYNIVQLDIPLVF